MSDIKVTQEKIEALFDGASLEIRRMGEKSCVMCATLANGFEIVVSSSCVDPANYDGAIGRRLCEEKVRDKLWELEGYLLQCSTGVGTGGDQ